MTDRLESIICSRYDQPSGDELYWDGLSSRLSPDYSRDWKAVAHQPELLPCVRHLKHEIEEIKAWGADIVIVSSISDTQVLPSIAISSLLAKASPKPQIVLGGHALRTRRSILIRHAWLFDIFDAICVSRGEPVVRALAFGSPLSQVPNILYRDQLVVRASRNVLATDAQDDFSADFSSLHLRDYLTPMLVLPIETGRGCYWGRCVFCGHPSRELSQNQRYRDHPVCKIVDELAAHVASGIRYFSFVDEAIHPDRLRLLCEEIIHRSLDVAWTCYLRCDPSLSLMDLSLARKAGCRKIFVGVETGSDRLLKLYVKGTTSETIVRLLNAASEVGLAVHTFLLDAFPDGTKADVQATESLLKAVLPNVDAFGFTYDVFPLSAEVDTPLHDHLGKFGAKKDRGLNIGDFAYDFSLKPARASRAQRFCTSETRIHSLVARSLSPHYGLRHASISHDSMHLPLIVSRNDGPDKHGDPKGLGRNPTA